MPIEIVDGIPVERTDAEIAEIRGEFRPAPVPSSVTNFQGRAVMRQLPMPDGRSLFSAVDGDLRAAVEVTKSLPEFDPRRLEADLNWQAWEQANDYERDGAVTQMLAGRYGIGKEQTDELFRQAEKVRA